MKAARRGRSSVAAAASTETETFNATCAENCTETCAECGKPTEPAQRDGYLCRCFSCDRKFRVSSNTGSIKVLYFVVNCKQSFH